ncbi:hypothetical protein CABS01_12882 [Colletotrichum abscissum]|uniref:uncharacterized protein n=1 Tax=Colletotrichum abscissum TaxID=1671311 RepID=UPI0027D68D18|nr:uncharacterized protein CABS01_12882 [Colletotrichum abscissum]KAK1488007.1 hypothetical protein CABS01_12882 [Colletotrichum abscissum]
MPAELSFRVQPAGEIYKPWTITRLHLQSTHKNEPFFSLVCSYFITFFQLQPSDSLIAHHQPTCHLIFLGPIICTSSKVSFRSSRSGSSQQSRHRDASGRLNEGSHYVKTSSSDRSREVPQGRSGYNRTREHGHGVSPKGRSGYN